MNKILALWAIPRSTSTAFEWMMRQRGDHSCRHEPFGEAWYFGEDSRTPRPNTAAVKPGLNYTSVWRDLRRDAAERAVFMKDFPHYIWHMADAAFLDHFNHSFLIRDPARMLPSMYDKWPDFRVEECGYEEQHALFELLCERDRAPPPLIDSDDLLRNPRATVRTYCEAVGIPYIEDALSWDEGERTSVSWYDKGSWHDNLKSSTGLTRQQTNYVDISHNDHLLSAYEACRPHYEAMYQHRLKVAQPA
jgi:adenylylsulfate kinase